MSIFNFIDLTPQSHDADEPLVIIDNISIAQLSNIELLHKEVKAEEKTVYRKSEQTITPEIEVKDDDQNKKEQSIIPEDLALSEEIKTSQTQKTNKKQLINEELVQPRTENVKIAKRATPREEELASVLQSIKKTPDSSLNSQGNANGALGKGNTTHDATKQLSISVLDAIRSKFIKCWTLPYGAKDIEKMKVVISLKLDHRGNVLSATLNNIYAYNNNPFFRALADSALRAVHRCSPITDLPENQYQNWKELELVFDPRYMF